MYYVKIGGLLYLRCPGGIPKTASSSGMLTPENITNYRRDTPYQSENPLLRGIPATSSRTAPPLVVTMGTSGV